jgi:heat shock protein HslJ
MTKLAQFPQFAATALVLLGYTYTKAESASGKSRASTWVLQQGVEMALRNARKPELRVEANRLSGSTGCNNFSATLNARPNQRVAIEEIARTRMLCELNQNDIENALVRAFEKTEAIRKKGRTLTFFSGDGSTLLIWKRFGKFAAVGIKRYARVRARAPRAVPYRRACSI